MSTAAQQLMAPAGATVREDFLVRSARVLFMGGLFLVSLLVVRVGGGITVGDVLLMGSAALLALGPRDPEIPTPTTPAPLTMLVAALLIIGGGLSTAISPSPLDSAFTVLRVAYVVLVLPWQAVRLLNTRRHLSAAFTAFALGAALCGFGTVLQYKLGAGIIPGGQVTNVGRFAGFTADVSDTGGITCLAVVLGVAGLGRGTSKKTKVMSLAILACGIIGLVLSGSVSGMIAACVGCLVIVLLRGVPIFRLVLVGVASAIALNFATSALSSTKNALSPLERFYQTIGVTGDSSLNTTASRLETDRLGLASFAHNPFTGVGLDSQSAIVDPYSNLAVHDLFIGALYQGGLFFGLGVLIATIAAVVRALRWVSRDGLSVRASACAAAALVFAITAPSFFNRYFWIPMAFVAAQAALARRGRLVE